MINEIRNQAIISLEKLEITELCSLTAEEKMFLSHFSLSTKPFTVECTLEHNRSDSTITFCLYSRTKLLCNVKRHMEIYHYELYQKLDENDHWPPVVMYFCLNFLLSN